MNIHYSHDVVTFQKAAKLDGNNIPLIVTGSSTPPTKVGANLTKYFEVRHHPIPKD